MIKLLRQTQLSLIITGVLLGLVARVIFGPPEPDTPPPPSFETEVPEEFLSVSPLAEFEPKENSND